MWLQRQVAPQQQLCRSLHTYTAPSTAARRRTLAGNRHTPLAAQSVSAPVSDIDVNQLYQGHVQLAGSSIGPVKAIRVVGQGRGLQTTRSVSPGDTLLVSSPLCLTRRSEQDIDETGQDLTASPYLLTDEDVEELLQQLERAPSKAALDAQEAWLEHLDNGTPDRQKLLPDVTSLAAAAAAAGLRGQPRGGGSHVATWAQDMGMGDEADTALSHVLDIVDINAIAEEQDPCVVLQPSPSSSGAASDGEPVSGASSSTDQGASSSSSSSSPQILLGLWPEAALLNHSCVPNTAIVPVQGHLVLRAVRPVAKEGQLTRSYLGPLSWAPLEVRQAALKDTWGFTCTCARCKEEAKLDSNMQQLINDTYQAVTEELSPDLAQAFTAGDAAGVSQVCEQVQLAAEVLDAAFNKLGLKQQTQLWVQVSLFRLYELAAAASSVASGETDPRMLELLTALAAEGAPGSQAHVQLAAQYLEGVSADEDAAFTGALNYAEDLALEAFRLRYGSQLSRSTFRAQLAALADAGEVEEEGEAE